MRSGSFCTIELKNRSNKYLEEIAKKFINEAPRLEFLDPFVYGIDEDGDDGFIDISVYYEPFWFDQRKSIEEVDIERDEEYSSNLYTEYRKLFDYAKRWSKENAIKINSISSFCELLNTY